MDAEASSIILDGSVQPRRLHMAPVVSQIRLLGPGAVFVAPLPQRNGVMMMKMSNHSQTRLPASIFNN